MQAMLRLVGGWLPACNALTTVIEGGIMMPLQRMHLAGIVAGSVKCES
jgi:hypothetical protein